MHLNRDSILFVVYALASAGITVATGHGWLPATDATEITGVMTAFAVAFHIPNAKAAEALKATQEPVVPEDASIDALLAGRAEPVA
jgi:hypothetical protein